MSTAATAARFALRPTRGKSTRLVFMWCRASCQNLSVPPPPSLACGPGNRPGDFVQQVDNVDRQAAALLRAAGLPFDEIEAPFAAGIYDDKVIRPASSRLPISATAGVPLSWRKAPTRRIRRQGSRRQVLGRAAGFATAGCAKNADARLGVRQAEACPLPQSRNTVCGWNSGKRFLSLVTPKMVGGVPVESGKGKTGCQGHAALRPVARAARLWRHPTGGRLGMVPRAARLWAERVNREGDAVPWAGFVRAAVLTGRCNRPVGRAGP